MDILQDEVKLTVEKPDKILNCDHCDRCFYLKKFKGKGDMLVMAELVKEKELEIKCFGWIQNVLYPS